MSDTTTDSGPRCSQCGEPISRAATGMLSMSITTLCADCERTA